MVPRIIRVMISNDIAPNGIMLSYYIIVVSCRLYYGMLPV
jgi:hypothetical protein